MEHSVSHSGCGSWLSLVAETAGVSGATIARVELSAHDQFYGPIRAVIQVVDDRGQIVGATRWSGNAADLATGVAVDLGCDLSSTWGSQVIAWVEQASVVSSPRCAEAPQYATHHSFDPIRSMKLMLHKAAPDGGQNDGVPAAA